MAMTKGLQRPFNRTNKRDAYKTLTTADRAALPFLGKKVTDPNDRKFGLSQEQNLIQHIRDRLVLSDWERRVRVDRLRDIDIQLSGLVRFEDEDKTNNKNNKRGKAPKPVKHSLTLAYSQIDDAVTYCMSVFAPEANIFIATSSADKQAIAQGLTKEIDRQGQKLQYYRQIAKFVLNAMKYNLAAVAVNWERQEGVTWATDAGQAGQITKQQGVLWEGNVIRSLSMYNFFYDTSVQHPVDLPSKGEYFAEVERTTPFRVRRMGELNQLFGVERFANEVAPLASQENGFFYIAPPIVREPAEVRNDGSMDWRQVLNPGGPAQESQLGIELVWYTGWVQPKRFGLSDSTLLELWRFCMANTHYIAASYHIEDSHGQLPCAIAAPIEDDLNNDQRTYAEQLLPLQHFASFLLNTHVDATRKSIYGITVFDSSLFPGLDLGTEDLIGMRIPMKSSATGIDIDKAFRHYNDAPNTDQNVDMVAKIVELMQKILPTNMLQQVADLERATEYQAAATVQAGSRRNLKIARIINDQALSVLKFQMMYNIYANMNAIQFIGADGKQTTITPAQILDANIEFDLGTGLRGLDRLMQISIFKEIMGYLFQIAGIQQEVDVLGLLSYTAEIAGFKTDLSQFRVAPPGTGLTPPPNPNGQQASQTPQAGALVNGQS
jgi:hypothetical protein